MDVETEQVQRVQIRVLPDGRVSRRDAAAFLGRKPKTLAIWASERRGPPMVHVGGRVFYKIGDLRAFAGTPEATTGAA